MNATTKSTKVSSIAASIAASQEDAIAFAQDSAIPTDISPAHEPATIAYKDDISFAPEAVIEIPTCELKPCIVVELPLSDGFRHVRMELCNCGCGTYYAATSYDKELLKKQEFDIVHVMAGSIKDSVIVHFGVFHEADTESNEVVDGAESDAFEAVDSIIETVYAGLHKVVQQFDKFPE